MYTDCKILHDFTIKRSLTQKRRLMIELRAIRVAYKCHDISNVSSIRVHHNPADSMSKPSNCEPFPKLLRAGKADFKIDQWFIKHACIIKY